MSVKLGSKVRDLVTKLEGIATSRTVWLNGCVRIGVEYVKDGEPKSFTCDEEQAKVLKVDAVKIPRSTFREIVDSLDDAPISRTGGGGRPDPVRR